VGTEGVLVHNSCVISSKSLLDEGLKRQNFNIGDNYPTRYKTKWTDASTLIEYEVRIHEGEALYGRTGNIYRVARRRPGLDINGQGYGWEYLDINGIWHHTSTLKPTSPTYNPQAARETHINIPNNVIE
jgi:hypothetical protein